VLVYDRKIKGYKLTIATSSYVYHTCLVLTNSQRVADKKEGVGTYCFILRLGLRITFSMDKATAHTKGYVETH
jgi:hypothetical protein